MTRTAPHGPLHPGTVTLPQGCLAQSSWNCCVLTVPKKISVNPWVIPTNHFPRSQQVAGHSRLCMEHLLHGGNRLLTPTQGEASSQTDGFPLSPPPALPQGCTEFPMLPSELPFYDTNEFYVQKRCPCSPCLVSTSGQHPSLWLYHEPDAPHGSSLLTHPSCVLGHARGCESLFLLWKNTQFSFFWAAWQKIRSATREPKLWPGRCW